MPSDFETLKNQLWSRVTINRLNDLMEQLRPLQNIYTDDTGPLVVSPDSNGVYIGLDLTALLSQSQAASYPSTACVYNPGASNVFPAGLLTTVTWNTDFLWDSDAYWNPATPDRLTPPDPYGFYQIEASVNLIVNTADAGKIARVTIYNNIGLEVARASAPVPATGSRLSLIASALTFALADIDKFYWPPYYIVTVFNGGSHDWGLDSQFGYDSRFQIFRVVGFNSQPVQNRTGGQAYTTITTEGGLILMTEAGSGIRTG